MKICDHAYFSNFAIECRLHKYDCNSRQYCIQGKCVSSKYHLDKLIAMNYIIWRNRDPHFHYKLYYVISGECPKTHKYAYKKGKECCNTTKDCNDKPLKMNSDCCQYDDYKECPSKSCFNHGSGENLFLEVICKSKSVLRKKQK